MKMNSAITYFPLSNLPDSLPSKFRLFITLETAGARADFAA